MRLQSDKSCKLASWTPLGSLSRAIIEIFSFLSVISMLFLDLGLLHSGLGTEAGATPLDLTNYDATEQYYEQ